MAIDNDLVAAQRAIELPEVQEMMKRLAAYNLGVFMPHMHDARGNMVPLPEGVVQVEDNLQVSFQPKGQVIDTAEAQYLTVGWCWSASGPGTKVVCSIARQSDGTYKHVRTSQTN